MVSNNYVQNKKNLKQNQDTDQNTNWEWIRRSRSFVLFMKLKQYEVTAWQWSRSIDSNIKKVGLNPQTAFCITFYVTQELVHSCPKLLFHSWVLKLVIQSIITRGGKTQWDS